MGERTDRDKNLLTDRIPDSIRWHGDDGQIVKVVDRPRATFSRAPKDAAYRVCVYELQ